MFVVRIAAGSPPRMRGKRYPAVDTGRHHGITPADAGKTVNQRKRLNMEEDHPRGCGENIRLSPFAVATRGSPPRMRGKRRFGRSSGIAVGITPADAGKTDRRSR